MYDLVYKEKEDTGVIVWLDNPEWQDHNMNVCDQKNAAGCRVAHDLAHPDMCIIIDEVGSHTSQRGDWYIRGKLLVCAKGVVLLHKSSTKDKDWTLFGLTTLNGNPVTYLYLSGDNSTVFDTMETKRISHVTYSR